MTSKRDAIQPRDILIAPSMLACDLGHLSEEIGKVEEAGADLLHFDIMDGHFVPNITFGLPVLASVRKCTKLPFDSHLMISDADRYIDDFKRVGSNWISVHIEACRHISRTLQHIRSSGMLAGVAINPGTSLSNLDAILDDADFVLLMSVNPGFGGQQFIPHSRDRVRELKGKIGNRKIRIEIDGGIKQNNAGSAAAAGADTLVVGTAIFSTDNYRKAIQSLRTACGG